MPDCIKRGFPVAKYLSQFCIHNNEHTRYKQELFGYEPGVKSDHLRACLLRLIIKSASHKDAIYLTDGALTLCLLKLHFH